MAKKIYAKVRLIEKRTVSTQFDRLTFQGLDLEAFPAGCEGGYIKLLFDGDGRALEAQPVSTDEKPVVRSFTIVEYAADCLSIDIVRGKSQGVAARWAEAAEPGDVIVVVGPGKAQPFPAGYDNYFIVGDETAIPAIQVQLENQGAISGTAILQSRAGAFDSALIPPSMLLNHVDREIDGHQALIQAAISQSWPSGSVYVWAACEFSQMRELRRYFRQTRGVDKQDMYISSYWKLGETDEGNKLAKKLDEEKDL